MRLKSRSAAVLFLSVWAGLGVASAATLNILNGSTPVGTLVSEVDPYGLETGTFSLLPAFRSYMSDAAGRQFRFFQTIYYDDEPIAWNGVVAPAGAPAHTATIVDPPAGGWDYEQPAGCSPTQPDCAGDDYSPFYEADTSANPISGNPYIFGGYPDVHAPDSDPDGWVTTVDWPLLAGPNHRTLFETYIAFVDQALYQAKTFRILGGYSWGVETNQFADESGLGPENIPLSAITPAKLAELQAALDRSGFSQWTVEARQVWYPGAAVPEPGTFGLVLAGTAAALAAARRRARG